MDVHNNDNSHNTVERLTKVETRLDNLERSMSSINAHLDNIERANMQTNVLLEHMVEQSKRREDREDRILAAQHAARADLRNAATGGAKAVWDAVRVPLGWAMLVVLSAVGARCGVATTPLQMSLTSPPQIGTMD